MATTLKNICLISGENDPFLGKKNLFASNFVEKVIYFDIFHDTLVSFHEFLELFFQVSADVSSEQRYVPQGDNKWSV